MRIWSPAAESQSLLVLAPIPDTGPASGGNLVTVLGIGFTVGSVVSFDNEEAETHFVGFQNGGPQLNGGFVAVMGGYLRSVSTTFTLGSAT